eukprot:TRINITY_DN62842_c0_g1_i1.p2 TRINITY_DN62842_c0_g1~~TRINITY_DN62842_c0_g1_i1.p2  ORF type:complete len:206 (-),score=39.32 TRINITY_DN62842_c0_g1_i1:114-731(-)
MLQRWLPEYGTWLKRLWTWAEDHWWTIDKLVKLFFSLFLLCFSYVVYAHVAVLLKSEGWALAGTLTAIVLALCFSDDFRIWDEMHEETEADPAQDSSDEVPGQDQGVEVLPPITEEHPHFDENEFYRARAAAMDVFERTKDDIGSDANMLMERCRRLEEMLEQMEASSDAEDRSSDTEDRTRDAADGGGAAKDPTLRQRRPFSKG